MLTTLCWQKKNSTRSAGTRPLRSLHTEALGKGRQESQDNNTLLAPLRQARQHALVILHFGTIRVHFQLGFNQGERQLKNANGAGAAGASESTFGFRLAH
jgi:hypothetical protein